jgi:hypothetical protein
MSQIVPLISALSNRSRLKSKIVAGTQKKESYLRSKPLEADINSSRVYPVWKLSDFSLRYPA